MASIIVQRRVIDGVGNGMSWYGDVKSHGKEREKLIRAVTEVTSNFGVRFTDGYLGGIIRVGPFANTYDAEKVLVEINNYYQYLSSTSLKSHPLPSYKNWKDRCRKKTEEKAKKAEGQ